MNHIQVVPQILLVGMLEGGTSKNDILATIPCIVDQPGKSLEPGLAVLVSQRDAPAHLLDVLRWMVVVGVTELPAEFGSHHLANGRFARARNTHEDHDHSIHPLLMRSEDRLSAIDRIHLSSGSQPTEDPALS